MVACVELTPSKVQAKTALFTPDGKISRKYPPETTAVLRLKGQQNAAVSGKRGWGICEREADRRGGETLLGLVIVDIAKEP